MRKYDLKTFLEKYNKKYPDSKYIFSKSIYISSKTKMKVICPIHGEFEIRPNDLMCGTGCPLCGGTKKMTKEEFIEKAKQVHNDFFTYEHCNFLTVNDKVTVTCPIHGDFDVKANNHLNGCNCKKCQKENIFHNINKLKKINSSTKKLNTETFIEKANKFNLNGKYDFSDVVYKKNNEKIKIKCNKHGYFYITPNHFLKGRGCPSCAKNKKKNTEIFVKELKDKQPNSDYDYSMVKYVNHHQAEDLVACGLFHNWGID